MDELRGPNIQVVLHIKEGLGFGFLKSSFVVCGSLNGYMLETDPAVPSHTPAFDAELVWEADKRRFRSLRVQNVPVKLEVYTVGTAGRKDKIGYLLLSLLGAQPCPSNKIVDVKYTWHRLLGVKSEGKCCHPQLLMSLSIEDRVGTPTPRNELRIFHSNEIAYPTTCRSIGAPTTRSMSFTLNDYLAESKKTVSSPDLQPKLLSDVGLIQIGCGTHLFLLSFVIGAVENLDLLLPYQSTKEAADCHVSYSIFTHNISTDKVASSVISSGTRAQFNQRTSLRLASDLHSLQRYFAECPHLVTRICLQDADVGICSLDLRKLIPTENVDDFIDKFCNDGPSLTINERCHIVRCDSSERNVRETRRPYVDIEMSLKYIGVKVAERGPLLSARSATQLKSGRQVDRAVSENCLQHRGASCTDVRDTRGYTHSTGHRSDRHKNPSGDAVIQTNEIADLIKKMCETLSESQNKLIASQARPATSDMQIQCETERDAPVRLVPEPVRDEKIPEVNQCETCTRNNFNTKDAIKSTISAAERDAIMQKFVDELEDWKEKQQEMFKCQLKLKEEYHLDLLAKEWSKQRVQLESKLSGAIQRCTELAAGLSQASLQLSHRKHNDSRRERQLLDAKKALETHYTAKYQQLREASQKMEDDMNHQLKLKDMKIEELEMKVTVLEKNNQVLKNNLKNCEKEAETRYSGLTKDQTASLIQELRCLEEKLDSAVQSKAFFKEQWGRAVRELHRLKLTHRKQLLTSLQHEREQLGDIRLETGVDVNEIKSNREPLNINRLKDDFYIDILANTPALEENSFITTSVPDVMNIYNDTATLTNIGPPKNPMNEKLNDLISQRDSLIKDDSPDEEQLKQLNHEIRSMLLNCGTL